MGHTSGPREVRWLEAAQGVRSGGVAVKVGGEAWRRTGDKQPQLGGEFQFKSPRHGAGRQQTQLAE